MRPGEANRSFVEGAVWDVQQSSASYRRVFIFFMKTTGFSETFEPIYHATIHNTGGGSVPYNADVKIVPSEPLLKVLTN